MAGILIFLLVGGLIAGAIAISHEQAKQREKAWSAAADELGLSYVAGTGFAPRPELHGELRGVLVRVHVETKGSGDDQTHYTRYHLRYPGMSTAPITLRRQTSFSFFGKLIGRKDVPVGDPVFDDRVVVDADDPVAATRFLTPARCVAVLTLFESWRNVEVSANSIIVDVRSIEGSSENLVATITRLLDLALVMSAPSSVDVALEQQARGDLADAVDSLHHINDVQDAPPNSFTQLLEAEALVALGDGTKAAEVLDDIAVQDSSIAAWKAVAETHPVPAPVPTPSPLHEPAETPLEQPPPIAQPVPLDQEAVITDLFGSNRLGHEVEARFFEAYEGATVEWTGTLERSREFRSDSDFPGSGVKATVRIGSKGDGRLVSDQILAIVHLPEGTAVERDTTLTFRGSFIRVDRYMRNLFVANAALGRDSP